MTESARWIAHFTSTKTINPIISKHASGFVYFCHLERAFIFPSDACYSLLTKVEDLCSNVIRLLFHVILVALILSSDDFL